MKYREGTIPTPNLFSNETDRTELLILLTPHVIHGPEEARAMTDNLLKRLDRERVAIESAKRKQ